MSRYPPRHSHGQKPGLDEARKRRILNMARAIGLLPTARAYGMNERTVSKICSDMGWLPRMKGDGPEPPEAA